MTSGKDFSGQVAIVTAGASGIGRAIVEALHRRGAQVVCADVNAEALAGVAAALPGSVTERADVTREADVEALVAATMARFGRLDCAFNVAGGGRSGYLVDLEEADWMHTLNLSLTSVFLCMKHEARQMLTAGAGAIVNIASLNAHVPMYGGGAYATAKAGVEMITRNAALEFTEGGVRVNAILPGLTQTPMTRRHFDNPAAHTAFMERIPMRRAGQPEEIAEPALFLAGDGARYISGVSLLVDGGWAVTGYPDMRPFRGTPGWPRR